VLAGAVVGGVTLLPGGRCCYVVGDDRDGDDDGHVFPRLLDEERRRQQQQQVHATEDGHRPGALEQSFLANFLWTSRTPRHATPRRDDDTKTP
jgi:hypothetical protein